VGWSSTNGPDRSSVGWAAELRPRVGGAGKSFVWPPRSLGCGVGRIFVLGRGAGKGSADESAVGQSLEQLSFVLGGATDQRTPAGRWGVLRRRRPGVSGAELSTLAVFVTLSLASAARSSGPG
jgi:hypothetical protein